jgi:hypothetical protein
MRWLQERLQMETIRRAKQLKQSTSQIAPRSVLLEPYIYTSDRLRAQVPKYRRLCPRNSKTTPASKNTDTPSLARRTARTIRHLNIHTPSCMVHLYKPPVCNPHLYPQRNFSPSQQPHPLSSLLSRYRLLAHMRWDPSSRIASWGRRVQPLCKQRQTPNQVHRQASRLDFWTFFGQEQISAYHQRSIPLTCLSMRPSTSLQA